MVKWKLVKRKEFNTKEDAIKDRMKHIDNRCDTNLYFRNGKFVLEYLKRID
jgi:hypothetical protein